LYNEHIPDNISSVVIVCALWLFSELVLGRINRSRRHGVAIRNEDKGSGRLIDINMCLNLTVILLFVFSGITPLPSWVFYLGICLMTVGILLRQWSVAVLGRYFNKFDRRTRRAEGGGSGAVSARTPSRLYGIAAYGSGLGFVSQTLGCVLVLIAIFGVVFSYRIRVEGEFLTSKLGDEYVAYSKRTKRLIPCIL